MKKLAAILCLSALATGAFAQGLVNFFNGPSTIITYNGAAMPANTSQTFYFGLLTAPAGTTDLTQFSLATVGGAGAYGTNQVAPGRFTGGNGIAIDNWAAGVTRAFAVAGWDAALGHNFNSAWLALPPGTPGFGVSAIASGAPGGGPQSLPNLFIFGASPSISQGFVIPVPEPTTMALAGLGAAALLIFRRRN